MKHQGGKLIKMKKNVFNHLEMSIVSNQSPTIASCPSSITSEPDFGLS